MRWLTFGLLLVLFFGNLIIATDADKRTALDRLSSLLLVGLAAASLWWLWNLQR